jgi:hypothetical protein
VIAREDPHDIRVGDRVKGNGTRTFRSDGPAAPGVVVVVNDLHVIIRKPSQRRAGKTRDVRVARLRVWADGKDRATGYTVTGENDNNGGKAE